MNHSSGKNPASDHEESHGLTPADVAWLAHLFTNGGFRRSPAEIAQMKALLDAWCSITPATPPAPALPKESQLALLDITDDLGHLRALFTALDMALADLQEHDSRTALCTLADTIHTRLRAIRDAIERVRQPTPLAA